MIQIQKSAQPRPQGCPRGGHDERDYPADSPGDEVEKCQALPSVLRRPWYWVKFGRQRHIGRHVVSSCVPRSSAEIFKMSKKQTPSDFLKQIIGRPVVVKLNNGVDYRGKLALKFESSIITLSVLIFKLPSVENSVRRCTYMSEQVRNFTVNEY